MDSTEIAVLIGGFGLIALILWYFFGERSPTGSNPGNTPSK